MDTRLTRYPARIVLAASGWTALAATALPDGSPPRVVLVVGFLLTCPGAATVRLVRPALARHGRALDGLEAATLTVALSLSIATLVAEAYFIGHVFTTPRALGTVALLTTLIALMPQHARQRRRHRAMRKPHG